MSHPYLAIQVVMMPRDTNPLGSIFGGVILSYIDQAGAIGARREVVRAGGERPNLVTVALNRVEFHRQYPEHGDCYLGQRQQRYFLSDTIASGGRVESHKRACFLADFAGGRYSGHHAHRHGGHAGRRATNSGAGAIQREPCFSGEHGAP